jgi:hypothetical protein
MQTVDAQTRPVPGDEAPERLTQVDIRELLGWALAGAMGLFIAVQYFFAAFPEAAVDFRMSRDEAQELAREFVRQAVDPDAPDHPVEEYLGSIVFRVEEDENGGGPKVYLERELGLTEANRLMAGEVSVWYWEVRYFRPRQREEFRIHVSPGGRIVGYTHTIEEARAGARLTQDAAQAIAEQFARERVKAPLEHYDFLPEEANATERPNRRDWKFTWERRDFRAKDAPYRIEVTVQGNRGGGYREFLKVPEAWTRDFARLRSSNLLYQLSAQIPYMFLMGAVVLVLVDLGKRRLAPWGGALRLGIALAALFFVMNVNQWPITRASYDTNSAYSGFVLSQMGSAALVSLVLGVVVAFSAAAGEPLYRELQPAGLQLGALFRRATWLNALRSKEFFKATVIGLAMAAAHIGFVVAFYLLGRGIGFWSPQEIQYTDAVSTYAPWLFPLTISVFAASSEEFLFRLFAIPLLLRLTRSRVLAIVAPALVWGFLHSAYPQQPGYVRGIEVGLIGMVAGWVMLRWGIWATLVWHYTVDALLIGLFLLRSGSLYFKLSGGVVVALAVFPLAAAAGLFAVHRRFAANAKLLNQALPLVPREKDVAEAEARPAVRPTGYQGLSLPMRKGLALAGVASVLFLALTPRPESIGNFVRFSITANEAGARADAVLAARQVDARTYRRVVSVVNNFHGDTAEFLRRELGVAGANELYSTRVPAALWLARYFRDSEKEEYHVALLPDGSFHALHHPLAERAEGANLTKEEAQARAEAWLRGEKKIDLAQWHVVEATSDKRPGRTDHKMVWEEIQAINSLSGPGKDRAAHVRMEMKVQGEEVSGYRRFVKLPEEWERKHTEDTLARTAYAVSRVGALAAVVVWMLVIFFRNLRNTPVPWGRISRWALWAALAVAINMANNWPKVLLNYSTEIPLRMFMAISAVGIFFAVAVVYGGVFLALAFGWFFLARAFGEGRLPGWLGMPREYYRDALVLAACIPGMAMVVTGRLPALADTLLPTWKRSVNVNVPDGLDSLLPAASEIAGAVILGLLVAGVIGLCAGFVGQWREKRVWQAVFFAGMALAVTGMPANGADFGKNFVVAALQLGFLCFLVTRVLRFNLLGYFLVAATVALVSAAVELGRQPVEFYRLNAGLCAAAIAALIGLGVFLSRSAPGDA